LSAIVPESFKQAGTKFTASAATAINGLGDIVAERFGAIRTKIVDAASTAVDGLSETLAERLKQLKTSATAIAAGAAGMLPVKPTAPGAPAGPAVGGLEAFVPEGLQHAATSVKDAIQKSVTVASDALKPAASAVVGTVKTGLATFLPSNLKAIGSQINESIKMGLSSARSALGTIEQKIGLTGLESGVRELIKVGIPTPTHLAERRSAVAAEQAAEAEKFLAGAVAFTAQGMDKEAAAATRQATAMRVSSKTNELLAATFTGVGKAGTALRGAIATLGASIAGALGPIAGILAASILLTKAWDMFQDHLERQHAPMIWRMVCARLTRR
jgi:hypothetical protein